MAEFLQRDVPGQATVAEGLIVGHGIRTYDPAEPGTEFRLLTRSGKSDQTVEVFERVDPGCLEPLTRQDVVCLFNHDKNFPVARTANGSLVLSVDGQGLRYAATPLPGDRLREQVQSGLVRGSSFGSPVYSREVYRDGGKVVSLLRLTSLRDVGPVTFPAYTATSATTRDLPELNQWIDRVTRDQRRRRTLVYFGLKRG